MNISQIMESYGGMVNVSELTSNAEYKRLLRATNRGDVVRVRHGVYAEPTTLLNTMVDIEKLVPRGIVCMHTAWMHHQLCTLISSAFSVAIDRKRKVTLPEMPPIKLYYWKPENLTFGIEDTEIAGHHIRITDLERSVCDAIKYRNKIGVELCAEIVRSYLNRNTPNFSRLTNYASQLRILKTLNTYLEIALA